jgi:type IV pilus assembly protein PilX
MNRQYERASQRGSALIVVLMLLVVMMLLSLASIRGTLLKEKLSTNMRDRSLAFQATEAALREGESVAAATTVASLPTSGCNAGLCAKPVASDPPRWQSAGFWADGSGNWRETTVNVGSLTAKPRFIVELLDDSIPAKGSCTTSIDVSPESSCSGTERRFRITARSQAANRAEVILQSIYAVP